MARTGNFSHSCLYSILINSSGKTLKFGFLPPHGVQLAPDEEYPVFGDIRDVVGRSDRAGYRNQQALARALDRQDIVILQTPNPILMNLTTHLPRMLQLSGAGNTLSTVSPCWDVSGSESDDDIAA